MRALEIGLSHPTNFFYGSIGGNMDVLEADKSWVIRLSYLTKSWVKSSGKLKTVHHVKVILSCLPAENSKWLRLVSFPLHSSSCPLSENSDQSVGKLICYRKFQLNNQRTQISCRKKYSENLLVITIFFSNFASF